MSGRRAGGARANAAGVRWEGLTKVFSGPVAAVRNATGAIEPGQLAVLVGRSGSGKTTLLRLLAGLERPSSGRILFDGQQVQTWAAHRRRVAMVFQRPVFYPHLSVREHLEFGWRHGNTASVRQRSTDMAERLGIAPLLDRFPEQLSGGERQRVAIGRAILRAPRVLLLDEPFTHLDVPQRLDLREWLSQLHAELGGTILLVSHEPAEAWMLGQRLMVMVQGRVEQIGSRDCVRDFPAHQQVLECVSGLGVNWIVGRVDRVDDGWCFRGGGCEFRLKGWAAGQWQRRLDQSAPVSDGLATVILGLRPEDLTLAAAGRSPHNGAQVTRVDWLGDRRLVQVRVINQEPKASEGEVAGTFVSGAEPSKPCSTFLRVVTSNDDAVQLGSTVAVQLSSDRLYFFDGETGKNLTPAANGGEAEGSSSHKTYGKVLKR